MTTRPPAAWLALDLETTGLGYEQDFPYTRRDDVVLEAAALILDRDLNEIARFEPVVAHAGEDELALMGDYVRNMHTRTGLIEKVRASTTSREELDLAFSSWLSEHGVDRGAILLGNSVSLDADFTRSNLPHSFGHLGYRKIDVSSFKELLRPHHPELVESIDAAKDANPFAHTALSDILASREELLTYVRMFDLFPTAPETS